MSKQTRVAKTPDTANLILNPPPYSQGLCNLPRMPPWAHMGSFLWALFLANLPHQAARGSPTPKLAPPEKDPPETSGIQSARGSGLGGLRRSGTRGAARAARGLTRGSRVWATGSYPAFSFFCWGGVQTKGKSRKTRLIDSPHSRYEFSTTLRVQCSPCDFTNVRNRLQAVHMRCSFLPDAVLPGLFAPFRHQSLKKQVDSMTRWMYSLLLNMLGLINVRIVFCRPCGLTWEDWSHADRLRPTAGCTQGLAFWCV